MKIARIYMRVSTRDQDLRRQDEILMSAKEAGYYIAGVYRDIESGVRYDRPELMRMLGDIQPGDVVIAEKMDRLSRGPLPEAEKFVQSLMDKGARLSIPGVVDLNDLIATVDDDIAKIMLDASQRTLLKVALQLANDDWESRRERQRQGIKLAQQDGKYKGKRRNKALHDRVIALRKGKVSIAETARLAECSPAQVKRIWAAHKEKDDAPMSFGEVLAGLYKRAGELRKAPCSSSLRKLEMSLYEDLGGVFPLPPTKLDHGSIRAFCSMVQSDVERRSHDLSIDFSG